MAIQRPNKQTAKSANEWVKSRNGNLSVEEEKTVEAIKRFTVLMPESLHQELKVFCVQRGVSLKDFVVEAVEEKMQK